MVPVLYRVQDADETYELDAVADLAIWVKSSIQLLGACERLWVEGKKKPEKICEIAMDLYSWLFREIGMCRCWPG